MDISGTTLTMTRGDTETLTVSCTDSRNQPVKFKTGDVVYFSVKENIYDENYIFQKQVLSFTHDGKCIVDIESTDTNGLLFKSYIYDLQVKRGNGSVKTLVKPSTLTLTTEVTTIPIEQIV